MGLPILVELVTSSIVFEGDSRNGRDEVVDVVRNEFEGKVTLGVGEEERGGVSFESPV